MRAWTPGDWFIWYGAALTNMLLALLPQLLLRLGHPQLDHEEEKRS
jgi:hypothetical protein